jgi:hypothetical protein
MTNSK